jgi:hypothetical protein
LSTVIRPIKCFILKLNGKKVEPTVYHREINTYFCFILYHLV